MRGANKPFVVDVMSSADEALGDVVPIPALPVAGNVFWLKTDFVKKVIAIRKMCFVFMLECLKNYSLILMKRFCFSELNPGFCNCVLH
jgi:hypothetical protein